MELLEVSSNDFFMEQTQHLPLHSETTAQTQKKQIDSLDHQKYPAPFSHEQMIFGEKKIPT